MDYARPELLVEPDWLQQHADEPGVRIIDCATLEAYRRAHIPGAVHVATHNYIKERGGREGGAGMFVMPAAEFESLMSKLGVGNDTRVIVYDDNNGLVAARLWWVLNYYGHDNVQVLNGGWHRWLTEGRPITFHAMRPEQATFTAREVPALKATRAQLLVDHADPGCQVLDARTDEEWEGTHDRGNARAGHVLNARHLEWVHFVERADTRRFLPADELQRLLDDAGIQRDKPTITYCQGGIRAAHAAFVLRLLGYDDVRVYDGSMFEWANDPETPLEV